MVVLSKWRDIHPYIYLIVEEGIILNYSLNDSRIYTDHGRRLFIGTAIRVNGRLAFAFVKNGRIEGFIFFEDFCSKICSVKCVDYKIPC